MRMVMKTMKVSGNAVIKMPHLKASTAKKRGSKLIGALVAPPAESHIVGDTQPGAWCDVDAAACTTCHGGRRKAETYRS